jgi:hypothetical protein
LSLIDFPNPPYPSLSFEGAAQKFNFISTALSSVAFLGAKWRRATAFYVIWPSCFLAQKTGGVRVQGPLTPSMIGTS